MVVNMNMRSDTEGNINEYLSDTIASVFPAVACVDVDHSSNRELFAAKKGEICARFDAGIDDISRAQVKDEEARERLLSLMGAVREDMQEYEGGQHIFTDDKAPVELLGMKEIDGMIQEEASYYKKIYDDEGLGGVLEKLI
jgi:hypothetical protein